MSTTNTCKKCGYQDSFMVSPAPCPTPVGCPTPQPCSEVFDAQCVRYTGLPLSCTVAQTFNASPNPNPAPTGPIVNTNDTVAEALESIVDYICTETIVSTDIECDTDVVVESGTTVTDALVDIVDYFCNNTPAPGYTYEIGEYVESQGGVIFHRYKDGTTEHYLVVAKSDAATSASWDNRIGPGQPPMLMNTSSWNGASNYLILSGSTGSQFTSAAYAVSIYNSVVLISGWYLPAIDELNLLYNNRFNVNRTLSGNSSFGSISGATEIINENYWSSTEKNQTEALIFNFGIAGTYTGAGASMKTGSLRVRAIRKFSI
jgi:hypothetical protein